MNEAIKKIVKKGQEVFKMACMSLHKKDKGFYIQKNGITLIY